MATTANNNGSTNMTGQNLLIAELRSIYPTTDANIDALRQAAIARAIAEIREDVANGTVPSSVASFSELHDYVDANGYGGAFDVETMPSDVDDDTEYQNEFCAFWNAVHDECDRRIKAGEFRN